MKHGLTQHSAVLAIAAGCLVAACQDMPQPAAMEQHFSTPVVIDDGDLSIKHGSVYLTADDDPKIGPELHWRGARGSWTTGIDVANNGGSRDFVLAAKRDWPEKGDTNDLIYIAHNDATAPTVGIGMTPPSRDYRVQLSPQDDEPMMGTLLLRRGPAQTGHVLGVQDSAGVLRWWLDSDFWLKGASPMEASIAIKADDLRGRPLVLGRADGTAVYGFEYANDATGSLHMRYVTGGVTNLTLTTSGVPDFPNGLTASTIHVDSPVAPASSTAPCTRGDIRFDDDFVYVCVTTNTWKRSALSSW